MKHCVTSAQIIQSKELVYAINQAFEMTKPIFILIIGLKKQYVNK